MGTSAIHRARHRPHPQGGPRVRERGNSLQPPSLCIFSAADRQMDICRANALEAHTPTGAGRRVRAAPRRCAGRERDEERLGSETPARRRPARRARDRVVGRGSASAQRICRSRFTVCICACALARLAQALRCPAGGWPCCGLAWATRCCTRATCTRSSGIASAGWKARSLGQRCVCAFASARTRRVRAGRCEGLLLRKGVSHGRKEACA